jgi:hypothetical protein
MIDEDLTAWPRHERLGCTPETLVDALTGRMREHHRFLLAQHLQTIEQLEKTIAAFDTRRVRANQQRTLMG